MENRRPPAVDEDNHPERQTGHREEERIMGNLWDYDGTVIHNEMDHAVELIPYRADGQRAETNSEVIAPGGYRLVNNDHIGDNSFYILVAFMKDSEIPPHIGVVQGTSGKGGGITVGGSEGGTGGTVGFQFSETHTVGFSASMAAAIVPLKKKRERNRYESNADYRIVTKRVKAVIDQGMPITVDNLPPESVETNVWVLERLGTRNRKREEREGRASQGW
jgi:hypothetical protein